MKIKDMPARERPREKLLTYGAENMSDVELLAIFIRTGVKGKSALEISQELIKNKGISHILSSTNKQEFCTYDGLGEAKYATIRAIVELTKRHYYAKAHSTTIFNDQDTVIHFLMSKLYHMPNEIFSALFLDGNDSLIEYRELFVGSGRFVTISVREIAKVALQHDAVKIILAHNHPSGNTTPSEQDKKITRQIQKHLMPLHIEVLDHIIIGEGYYSFLDHGLI